MIRILLVFVWLGMVLFAEGFTVKSESFSGQLGIAQVNNVFGCTGKNISPDLLWEGVPEGTESFAITLYDPDAPTGSGWWHWIVYNIPGSIRRIPAGSSESKTMPQGTVEGLTSYGKPGFGGACPPKGAKPHRYILTLYALDTASLNLSSEAVPEMVGFNLNIHALAKASLEAYYGW